MSNETTVTLADLTAEIEEYERSIAPGSETSLWGDYIDAMRDETGHMPIGDYPEDAPVSIEQANWWRAAYDYMEAHPDAEMDDIVAAADKA